MSSSDVVRVRWQAADGLELVGAALTTQGPVRALNEDSVLVAPPVFLVADGMGGHQAGDVASRLVADRFAELAGSGVVTPERVSACLDQCRDEISRLVGSGTAAPGTTVVSAVWIVDEDRAYWLIANIGDSRAYVWREGDLRQLSHDHSVVQEMLDSGGITESEARVHPERHVITRALGARMKAPVDYSLLPVEPGSRLLLCSDGVCGPLTDEALSYHLTRFPEVGAAASALVDAAVSAGGRDNLTAVVIDVMGAPDAGVVEETVGNPVAHNGKEVE